ncbi:MAG: hypothetical protein LBD48_04040 [Treponema sp.]|jgi:hypothetical protein|nr:hypothetical protein [Treponema sp.]
MRNKVFVRGLAAIALMGASLFAWADEDAVSIADKLSLSLEFKTSVLSADSDGVVDSLTDAGFDEDESKIALSYDSDLWGGTAALKFSSETFRIFHGDIGDFAGQPPLSIDELFAWVKPFGEHFKFTGGVFENTDGLADYTGDIDNADMGVFITGEDDEPFSEPEEMTRPILANGLLTDAVFGPVTLQFLLAPNYSKESASDLVNGLLASSPALDLKQRFFRLGGRVIIDAGVGTAALMVKTFSWPVEVYNAVDKLYDPTNGGGFAGDKVDLTTFGAHFDLTAVENLGLSLGYTGFLVASDSGDADNTLWNGIDLRASWTGIEGLSISSHNNISFAKGGENEWMQVLTDGSFFSLYNGIGVTKELTEKFSVNAEIGNIFAKTETEGGDSKLTSENFWVEGKLIARVTGNAEFNAGLRVDFGNTATKDAANGDEDKSLTVFSIPVAIKVSF